MTKKQGDIMNNLKNIRSGEKGNALFLILIAVVLFAALSYAITQSNRGGGAPNRETSLVASTTITQYSSAIRTGITRMLLRNTAIADIKFDEPGSVGYAVVLDEPEQVFHPNGGGVSFQAPDLQTINTGGDWYFDATSNVVNIGTGADELIAFLTDVKQPICQRIVDQIYGDNTTIPVLAEAMADIVAGSANMTLTGATIDGQPFGCLSLTGGYVYYHVLAEQ